MPGLIDSDNVIDQANCTVAEFVLTEDYSHERRAKTCKCRQCVTDYKDALDRRDWALGMGRWLPSRQQKIHRAQELADE